MDPRLEQIHRLVSELRGEGTIAPGACFSHRVVERIADELGPFGDHPVVAAFIADCRRAATEPPDFRLTRDAVTEHDRDLILGMFSAPYNAELGLECLIYRREPLDSTLAERYAQTGVRPISIVAATGGFRFGLSVALFAENFVTAEPVAERHKAYYFVDRFAQRHWQITQPVLALCTAEAAFARLKAATAEDAKRASIMWVHLHEYFHRQGYMPLPAYLGMKSSRNAAGMEEVRCDILAAITAYKEWSRGLVDGDLVAEFIVAERLLRYPLQDDPQANYDVRGAQLLFGFLRERGVLREAGAGGAIGMRLELPASFGGVVEALREMAVGINKLEHAISTEHRQRAQALEKRVELVKELGGWDAETRRFEVLPFYHRVREDAKRAGINLVMDFRT